ncbi:MAG: hypothetical protein M1840_007581 [Geoglossum simile]|nr:MAG: hypothetical protein M1840_007581 [Geoglossum simile]
MLYSEKTSARKEQHAAKDSTLLYDHIRSVTSAGEEQLAVGKNLKASYDQARECLEHSNDRRSRANTGHSYSDLYENNFSIKMPVEEWMKLGHRLNYLEMDQRSGASLQDYSRCKANTLTLGIRNIRYNSSTSTLIIQFMPCPVRESVVSIFSAGFISATADLPAPVRRNIATVTGQDFIGFGGKYLGSGKRPDLAVLFKDAGARKAKFILEVGFAETYEDLVQDAKMWLEGKHEVSVVVLAKFEETPAYRCPTRDFNDEDFERLESPPALELDGSSIRLDGEYGPAIYKGLAWVGRISTAFMEVWKRDPVTGLATQNGDRIDICTPTDPPQLQFRLSDFLDITPENERTISFRWDNFLFFLQDSIKELAVLRYYNMLRLRAKQAGIRDHDYQPSSQGSSN